MVKRGRSLNTAALPNDLAGRRTVTTVSLDASPNHSAQRGRLWAALAILATSFLAAAHVVWSLFTGAFSAAVLGLAGAVFWYWIGVGALRRMQALS
jgi:hypothetical protein